MFVWLCAFTTSCCLPHDNGIPNRAKHIKISVKRSSFTIKENLYFSFFKEIIFFFHFFFFFFFQFFAISKLLITYNFSDCMWFCFMLLQSGLCNVLMFANHNTFLLFIDVKFKNLRKWMQIISISIEVAVV